MPLSRKDTILLLPTECAFFNNRRQLDAFIFLSADYLIIRTLQVNYLLTYPPTPSSEAETIEKGFI